MHTAQQKEELPVFRYLAVARQLRTMLESGTLKPGDKIPSLRKMSGMMGVSVATVSQAYLELEKQGMLESRERSGFYVRDSYRTPPPPDKVVPVAAPATVQRGELIRKVLDTVGRVEILPLGVAEPTPGILPVKALGRAMNSVIQRYGDLVTTYLPIVGDKGLREELARRMQNYGAAVRPDDLLITTGAMEALSVAMRAVTRPGDTVAICTPTYHCLLYLLEIMGLRAIEIPLHPETGVDPDQVGRVLERYQVNALVLTPNFNNPDGSLTPDAAKKELVRLAERHDLPLVEDDVSGELCYADERPSSCKKYDRFGHVLHCNSFSKTLAPGLRIGWIAPGKYMPRAYDIRSTGSVCTATVSQLTIREYLQNGQYDKHLRRLRVMLERHRDNALALLGRYFPEGTRATCPKGGALLWIELPQTVDAVAYFYEATAMRIGVSPGSIFSTHDKYNNFIRLNFAVQWTGEVEQGFKDLGDLAKRMAG